MSMIWLRNNKLKLNDDKTDLLVLTARHRPQPPIKSFAVGSDLIYPSETVKNLGTVFDTTLSLEKQVTAVCKADIRAIQFLEVGGGVGCIISGK